MMDGPLQRTTIGGTIGAARAAPLAALLACVLLFAATSADAGDIYRWVDDQGVTHIGDHVPEAYQSRARIVGDTNANADPNAQSEAKARAAHDAALLKQMDASKPVAAPAATPAARPAQSAGTDCASLWAAYHASQACYAPYVTQNGLRGGSTCTPAVDPSSQCGSQSVSPENLTPK